MRSIAPSSADGGKNPIIPEGLYKARVKSIIKQDAVKSKGKVAYIATFDVFIDDYVASMDKYFTIEGAPGEPVPSYIAYSLRQLSSLCHALADAYKDGDERRDKYLYLIPENGVLPFGPFLDRTVILKVEDRELKARRDITTGKEYPSVTVSEISFFKAYKEEEKTAPPPRKPVKIASAPLEIEIDEQEETVGSAFAWRK
jgi:hypothetical protein